MEQQFRIVKIWSVNNRDDNSCINIPKKFADEHKITGSQYCCVYNTMDGILIKPFLGLIQENNKNEN